LVSAPLTLAGDARVLAVLFRCPDGSTAPTLLRPERRLDRGMTDLAVLAPGACSWQAGNGSRMAKAIPPSETASYKTRFGTEDTLLHIMNPRHPADRQSVMLEPTKNKELAELLEFQQSLVNLAARCAPGKPPSKPPRGEPSRRLGQLVKKVRTRSS